MSLQPFIHRSLFILLLGAFTACEPDTEKIDDKVVGRWEITQAYRDGQPTGTLDQLFFEFLPSGRMRTNLSGAEEEAAYEISDATIQQRESRIEADYQVQEVTDSTLEMTTKLRDFNFRFVLKKVN